MRKKITKKKSDVRYKSSVETTNALNDNTHCDNTDMTCDESNNKIINSQNQMDKKYIINNKDVKNNMNINIQLEKKHEEQIKLNKNYDKKYLCLNDKKINKKRIITNNNALQKVLKMKYELLKRNNENFDLKEKKYEQKKPETQKTYDQICKNYEHIRNKYEQGIIHDEQHVEKPYKQALSHEYIDSFIQKNNYNDNINNYSNDHDGDMVHAHDSLCSNDYINNNNSIGNDKNRTNESITNHNENDNTYKKNVKDNRNIQKKKLEQINEKDINKFKESYYCHLSNVSNDDIYPNSEEPLSKHERDRLMHACVLSEYKIGKDNTTSNRGNSMANNRDSNMASNRDNNKTNSSFNNNQKKYTFEYNIEYFKMIDLFSAD
ncbi:conserved protein, unknown function, partial [Hepatocystis sp. ex Piliocolobus tephrosceles]